MPAIIKPVFDSTKETQKYPYTGAVNNSRSKLSFVLSYKKTP